MQIRIVNLKGRTKKKITNLTEIKSFFHFQLLKFSLKISIIINKK